MRWTVEYLTLIGPGAARLDLVAPFQHCVSMRRSLKTLTRRPEAQAERPSRAARWPPEGRSHRIAAAEGGGGQQPLPTSVQLCRKVLLWVLSRAACSCAPRAQGAETYGDRDREKLQGIHDARLGLDFMNLSICLSLCSYLRAWGRRCVE